MFENGGRQSKYVLAILEDPVQSPVKRKVRLTEISIRRTKVKRIGLLIHTKNYAEALKVWPNARVQRYEDQCREGFSRVVGLR